MNASTLIIADDSYLHYLVVSTFQQVGFQVFSIKSASHAQPYLKEIIPDVLVLDMTMETLPVLEIIQQIRKSPYGKSVNIIVVGRSEDQDSLEATSADVFLGKPVILSDLVGLAKWMKLTASKTEPLGKNMRDAIQARLGNS